MTTNDQWFSNWKDTMNGLNSMASQIAIGRIEANALMTKRLKELFTQNGTPIESITYSNDSTVITVYINGNAKSFIHFTKSFLIQLDMSFAVKRELDANGDNRLYLELYPLLEGDEILI